MTDQQSRRGDGAMAYLLLRAVIGLNILMHGISRIHAGLSTFADGMVGMFKQTPLPGPLVHVFGLSLPWAEAVIGFMLLTGAGTRVALIVASLMILCLTFGVGLRQDWQVAGLQLTYVLIYAVLLAFREYNLFSVDAFLAAKS
ncbi:MAG TPA: MauE/DoxX family redox-associated membrane protein [Acidobacteriaceae bacterium]|nr:MauE/DoxX family redox-associated membrane protein [Acidobacteriaceae bacterium]